MLETSWLTLPERLVIMSDQLSSGMVSSLAVMLQMQNLLAKVLNEYSTHYLTFGVESCAVNSKLGSF